MSDPSINTGKNRSGLNWVQLVFVVFPLLFVEACSLHADVVDELRIVLKRGKDADANYVQHTSPSPIKNALERYYESVLERRKSLTPDQTHEQELYYLPVELKTLTNALDEYSNLSFIESGNCLGKFGTTFITIEYNCDYTVQRYRLKPRTLYLEVSTQSVMDGPFVDHRFAVTTVIVEGIYQILRKYREWLIITFRENLSSGIEHALPEYAKIQASFNTDGRLLIVFPDGARLSLVAGEALQLLRLLECTCQSTSSYVNDCKQKQDRDAAVANQLGVEEKKRQSDQKLAEKLLH